VKLIRAHINPLGGFDLSEDLPRFSQGNEPPLNLTEKVNRVVMDRMRAARKNPREDTRSNMLEARDTKKEKQMQRKCRALPKASKLPPEITPKNDGTETNS
jgi:hypothetical protein